MKVGYKLYREIRDFAPANWTSGERIVALMIADSAGEDSRRSIITSDLLQARTGLKPSGIHSALQRLAERGYEFRICHGYGKDGRPVYAVKGHQPDYLVPMIAEIRVAQMGIDEPSAAADLACG